MHIKNFFFKLRVSVCYASNQCYQTILTLSIARISSTILISNLRTTRACCVSSRMNFKMQRMPETEVCIKVDLYCLACQLNVTFSVWIIGHVLAGWDGTNALLNPTNLCMYLSHWKLFRLLICIPYGLIQSIKCMAVSYLVLQVHL